MYDWKTSDKPARNGWAPGKYLGGCRSCFCKFIGAKRAYECADCAYAKPEPETETDAENDIVARLREACNGHPKAEIPWPHRLLHDAITEIETLRSQNSK